MKIYRLLIITTIVFLQGCIGHNQDSNKISYTNVKKIDIVPNRKLQIKLSEIADSISYVTLETDSNCLIGTIDKLIYYKNNYYILDKSITKSLFCFNHLGKFIFKIDKIGNGPGEYLYPTDFSLDTLNNNIFIYDSRSKKVNIYNKTGQFLNEIKFDELYCESFEYLGDDIFGFYANYVPNYKYSKRGLFFNLLLFNSNGDLSSKYFSFDKKLIDSRKIIANPVYFSSNSFNKSLLYTQYCNTIFIVDSSGPKPCYLLNYGVQLTEREVAIISRNSKSEFEVEMKLQNSGYIRLITVLQTNNHLFLTYRFKDEPHILVYSKNSEYVIEASNKFDVKSNKDYVIPIENDIDGGYFYYPISSTDKELLSVINPVELIDFIETQKSKNHVVSQELEKIVNKINVGDNQLIARIRLRRF
jgi:hypothetical protein